MRTVTCCHSKTSVMVVHSGRYPGASFFFAAGTGAGVTYSSIVVRRSIIVGESNHSVPWRGAILRVKTSGADQSRGAISRVTKQKPFL